MDCICPSGTMSCTAAGLMAASTEASLAACSAYITMQTLSVGVMAADGAHCLEAAQMAAHQQDAVLGRHVAAHDVLADDVDIEQVEAIVEQIDAVMHGSRRRQGSGGKSRRCGQAGPSTPPQVGGRGAPCTRREQQEVGGDEVEHDAAQTSAKAQRNPCHQPHGGGAAALSTLPPVFACGGRVHAATVRSAPLAMSRPAQSMRKLSLPAACGWAVKQSASPGRAGLENLRCCC